MFLFSITAQQKKKRKIYIRRPNKIQFYFKKKEIALKNIYICAHKYIYILNKKKKRKEKEIKLSRICKNIEKKKNFNAV